MFVDQPIQPEENTSPSDDLLFVKHTRSLATAINTSLRLRMLFAELFCPLTLLKLDHKPCDNSLEDLLQTLIHPKASEKYTTTILDVSFL